MNTSRQLAAILFADIQGYTALMQRDETRAMMLREKFQRILETEIKTRGGRVALFSGDGALCVFKSAIQAVHAAIAVQEQMAEDPQVPLRIGIHTGDVITEGKNVFGDGVNVASRIESFAVPGSVFVSRKVVDEIKNQPRIEFISLGRFELKNVDEAIDIFAIKTDKLVVPHKESLVGKGQTVKYRKYNPRKLLIGSALVLILLVAGLFTYTKFISRTTVSQSPFKTIAVLPFANLSGQKDDEYFADGICDEILTQLSKISALNVLSRTSTLQFRNTQKTMKEISDQIGADILLEGSVQKSNGKVRVVVQLIDALHDKHLWAETYDRELKDVFAIQSDIATQIAQALNTTLTQKEEELIAEKPTNNMEAFDFYLRGNKLANGFWESSKMDSVTNAIQMYEQANKLDPKFLNVYSALVSLYVEISFRKPVVNYEEYRMKARQWLDKMMALKIDNPIVHGTIAFYKYEGERDYAGALDELDQVDRANPNDKYSRGLRAYVLRRMGRIDDAQKLFLERYRASPKVSGYVSDVAETYEVLRNPDSAIYYVDKAIQLSPGNADFYIEKAIIYGKYKGDISKAEEVLKNASVVVDNNKFSNIYNEIAMLKGNYSDAINYFVSQKDSFYNLSQSYVVPYAQMIAVMLNNEGKKDEARIYFQKSLDIVSHLAQLHPEDFRMHAAMGVAYAGLGEKEKAFAEGNKAREMMPVSVDAVIGLAPLENLALINTLLGQQDAAIDILEQLLKMPCGWDITNTVPLYRTVPYWKLLQNNPRFQKMVQ
jgi:TolB-like protein/class 3 adenylate cyclase/Flp pilus assembly protein TadD